MKMGEYKDSSNTDESDENSTYTKVVEYATHVKRNENATFTKPDGSWSRR
ncbi:hypothetical protein PC129_g20271 [Phytophthora cactorum]|uniref:Uncharacterized protein n=1 Tax=Phytophthora cactorum TaxID=29920 RepID=A0A8T1H9I0_9STRA|nr:hypothetical protein Pcac1_g19801 [Phytophthora cactorum]KAG2812883.1 hypothetical protein PC112_g14980 [Phytophthora cactorum]KAG2817681.1 hypothetical protein PC111_g12623 [Phytophthora cactorum]KAG2892846.1 hypothetical protein PC114_g16485 [Phytophthora cactorum]KAG2917085.1 hypothetical protein PC117_g17551 [Phytophthora cactorum]